MKLDSQRTSGQGVVPSCWCTSCLGCSHGCISDGCSTACAAGCTGGCAGGKIEINL